MGRECLFVGWDWLDVVVVEALFKMSPSQASPFTTTRVGTATSDIPFRSSNVSR